MSRSLSLAIVGAGIGGLAAAAALRRTGIDVQVFEQAAAFAPVGAGIQLTANAIKALAGIGLGARLRAGDGLVLAFADGSRASAEAVVGADGIHSMVREVLFGAEQPRFTGKVAYRTTYPAARLGTRAVDQRAKWWGPDRHVVHYFTTPDRSEIYFIAATPEPDFAVESWSTPGDARTLQAAFQGFHPTVRAILADAPELRKWALVERDPLPAWGEGQVVLLGDSCHPMTPYMAQGAASALEDAVVLSRCLEGVSCDGVAVAFRRYEATRKERTSRIQLTNRPNTWMRVKTDTDWVYGYDAWTVPLAPA